MVFRRTAVNESKLQRTLMRSTSRWVFAGFSSRKTNSRAVYYLLEPSTGVKITLKSCTFVSCIHITLKKYLLNIYFCFTVLLCIFKITHTYQVLYTNQICKNCRFHFCNKKWASFTHTLHQQQLYRIPTPSPQTLMRSSWKKGEEAEDRRHRAVSILSLVSFLFWLDFFYLGLFQAQKFEPEIGLVELAQKSKVTSSAHPKVKQVG